MSVDSFRRSLTGLRRKEMAFELPQKGFFAIDVGSRFDV